MPNRDNAKGAVPRKHLLGGEIRTENVALAAANTAIGVGTALAHTSAGVYDIWSSGAIAGFAAEAKAASSGGTIKAYIDPFIVYSAQTDDGTGTGTAQTAINLNTTLVNNGTVSNGVSKAELDESAVLDTATLPVKLIGLYPSPDNAFGEFNELLFVINNSNFKGGTGTAGV